MRIDLATLSRLIIQPSLLLMSASGLCRGQPPPAPILEPGLRLHAVAKRVAAPAGDPVQLHWVAEPFPNASSVLITNPTLARTLTELLQRLAMGDQMCPAWVLEDAPACALAEKLRRELVEYRFSVRVPVNLLDPPDEEGQARDVELRVEYLIPQPRVVKSLAITVATGNVLPGRPTISDSLTVREAAQRVGMSSVSPDVDASRITVSLTDDDRKRPSGADFPLDRLETELFRAGLEVAAIAVGAGLSPGKSAPADADLTAIDDKIRLVYQIERPPWPARARTIHSADEYTIELLELRFVREVDVEVVRGTMPGENGPVDFTAATEAGEKKLAAILQAATARARAVLRADADTLEGRIPTRARVERTFDQLRRLPDTRGPLDVTSADRTMKFQTTYRWVDSQIDAKINLSAAFDPEQWLTGGGNVHEHNRLGLGEDVNLDLTGGPEAQNMNLNFNITRERESKPSLTYGLNVLAFYSRDRNQRLGNLPAFRGENDKDRQLIDKERGLQPKVFVQRDLPGSWKSRFRWEGALDWRHVLIQPRSKTLPARVDGLLAAWDNTIEERLWHDFTPTDAAKPGPGVGEVTLVAAGAFRRATSLFSGDFDFWRPQVSASAEALFGWRARKELLIRHRWGAGTASSTTPQFQLYRLGGPTNVRGIEEGEFVGRRLRFQQFTAGVALAAFWPALADAEGQLAALANSYITGFYDRGSVDQDDLHYFAHGYGFAFEIRNLPAAKQRVNLSIGWARSPQSFLHRRGVMTMGVNYSL